MEYTADDPVFSRPVLEMLTVANEYCLFLEKSEDYQKDDILNYLLRISPLLYLKGTLLPIISPENEDYDERFVNEQEWEDIFNTLHNKFGKDDTFLLIQPDDDISKETVTMSLAEQCSDIYQELKDFVMLYQKNTTTARDTAIYHCNRNFRIHWGISLLNILPHLHSLAYEETEQAENENYADVF